MGSWFKSFEMFWNFSYRFSGMCNPNLWFFSTGCYPKRDSLRLDKANVQNQPHRMFHRPPYMVKFNASHPPETGVRMSWASPKGRRVPLAQAPSPPPPPAPSASSSPPTQTGFCLLPPPTQNWLQNSPPATPDSLSPQSGLWVGGCCYSSRLGAAAARFILCVTETNAPEQPTLSAGFLKTGRCRSINTVATADKPLCRRRARRCVTIYSRVLSHNWEDSGRHWWPAQTRLELRAASVPPSVHCTPTTTLLCAGCGRDVSLCALSESPSAGRRERGQCTSTVSPYWLLPQL